MITFSDLARPSPKPAATRRFNHELDVELDEISLRRVVGQAGKMVDVGGYASANVRVGYTVADQWEILSIHLTGREMIRPSKLNPDFTLAEPAQWRDLLTPVLPTDPLYGVLAAAIRANHSEDVAEAIERSIAENEEYLHGLHIDLEIDALNEARAARRGA